MYQSWLVDPKSVHKSWDVYFRNVQNGVQPPAAFVPPPSLMSSFHGRTEQSSEANIQEAQKIHLNVSVQQIIRAYQVMGHNQAKIDPLGIMERPQIEALKPETYGITQAQLDTVINTGDIKVQGVTIGFLVEGKMTIRQIVDTLQRTYCGSVGVEYMHIQSLEKCNWLRERIEAPNAYQLSHEEKLNAYDRLSWATNFERFLAIKFQDKRFGCDGSEIMIPGLKFLIDQAGERGIKDIVFGMAHRGRLNVLSNVLRKPPEAIFHEFQYGTLTIDDIASGDVKYHLGTSYDRPTRQGKKVHLSLVANPSHLEAVNPVVEGKVAAKQFFINDTEHSTVMPVLIHGDASFAGQGVVYETATLSKLPHYKTGGSIHVIINNQIGFTTNPGDGRPGQYCTEVMKSTGAPIFHVNGDDPDAVCWIFKLAADWRQKFHDDIVIDIVCYRRHGHNESDQPKFTQPLMYSKIEKQPATLDIYGQKLINTGILSKERIKEIDATVNMVYNKAFDEAKNYKSKDSDWLSSKWEGFKGPDQLARIKNTGISKTVFDTVYQAITSYPSHFVLHPNLKRIMDQKKSTHDNGEPVDWATAEALAFGSLLLEGSHVRLSGQDVERGTFSHRHAVLHDQKTGATYTPLNNIPGQKSVFKVSNSFLSEFAVLGYELGFSLHDPNALVLWEAQFGDFVNGSQIILDQFLSSGEQKWLRQSGLTLLLPHGFEGMGPEHSSARLERFLQMCDQDFDAIPDPNDSPSKQIQRTNWQIVNCTTPANYFHVIRSQTHRDFRKPLIIFTPKSLLRHPLAKSPHTAFDDSGDSTRFIRVYWEVDKDLVPDNQIKKVVFCSGKVYYDLYEERNKRKIKDVALVRVEMLAPFPYHEIKREIQRYPNASITWCQEEPKNMGAYTFMFFNFRSLLRYANDSRELKYNGRSSSASPATGSSKQHQKEVQKLLNEVFSSK